MAQQQGLAHVRDRRSERFARAHGTGEVLDVRGSVGIVPGEIETVGDLRLAHLSHHRARDVVMHVAAAIEHDRAVRSENLRPTPAAERLSAVAALSLPDDGLSAVELEDHFLGVGKLPVVVEVVAAASGAHARGILDAERPAGDVDLVRAVVADLARSPPTEPVPVVMHDVVAIWGSRRRTLPQLEVEVGRHWHRLPAPNATPRIRVPRAPEVRAPDQPVTDRLNRLDGARSGPLLVSDLHLSRRRSLCTDEQLNLAR